MVIQHTLNLYIFIKYRNQAQPLQLIGRRNSSVEYKLDECWLLFAGILACNVEPDNDGCYGRFGSLASHIKNVFLPVLTKRRKLMNAPYCELRKYRRGSSKDVGFMTRSMEVRLEKKRDTSIG